MKNLAEDLTDLWTIPDLSKEVGNIYTSWHPANSDLTTGNCFTNVMVEDIQMLLLEYIFSYDDTIDHQLIVFIHVKGSFDSYAKHPKVIG